MMRRQHLRHSSRSGFTRIDLLVIVGIAVLVAAIVAPGISSRRPPGRMLQCLSNMRNVGLAMQNFAASNDGTLPPLTTSKIVRNSTDQEGTMIMAWPVLLLPALDNTALLRAIRNNAVIESRQARIGDNERVALEVLGCPYDDNSFRKPGGLSFVVNTGFITENLYHGDPERKHQPGSLSWGASRDIDIAVQQATGVAWHANQESQSHLDYVSSGDGASVTLLLTESLQAGNWYDTDTARISFAFPVANTNGLVKLGKGGLFESTEKPLDSEFDGGTLTTANPQDWRINSDLRAPVGTRPRPSSNHSGGVNVIMCDGSGRFLNQNIDPHVYLKLMTSNGSAYGEGELKQSTY